MKSEINALLDSATQAIGNKDFVLVVSCHKTDDDTQVCQAAFTKHQDEYVNVKLQEAPFDNIFINAKTDVLELVAKIQQNFAFL